MAPANGSWGASSGKRRPSRYARLREPEMCPAGAIAGFRAYGRDMFVFIKLVEVGDPNGYTNRTISDVAYEDAVNELSYSYDLNPSGALRVIRVPVGPPPAVESVFSPGVWFRAQGLWHGAGSSGAS